MNEPTTSQIIDSMERHGGGFVKALALAMSRADSQNLERIKNAFPDYMTLYSDWAVTDSEEKP